MCESLDEETIVIPIVLRRTRRATKCLLSCRDNGCATNNPFKANHPLLYRPIRYRWTEGRLAYLLLLVVCSQGLCNRAYEKFDDVPLWNVFSFVFETQCWWPQDRDKNWIYYDGQTVGGTTTVVAQQWRYVRCASTLSTLVGRSERQSWRIYLESFLGASPSVFIGQKRMFLFHHLLFEENWENESNPNSNQKLISKKSNQSYQSKQTTVGNSFFIHTAQHYIQSDPVPCWRYCQPVYQLMELGGWMQAFPNSTTGMK